MVRLQGQHNNQEGWPTFYIASVNRGGTFNLGSIIHHWRIDNNLEDRNPLIARIFHPFYALTAKDYGRQPKETPPWISVLQYGSQAGHFGSNGPRLEDAAWVTNLMFGMDHVNQGVHLTQYIGWLHRLLRIDRNDGVEQGEEAH